MRGGAGDRHAGRRYLSQHCGKEGCSRKGAGRLGRWVPHEGHGLRRYLGFSHRFKMLLGFTDTHESCAASFPLLQQSLRGKWLKNTSGAGKKIDGENFCYFLSPTQSFKMIHLVLHTKYFLCYLKVCETHYSKQSTMVLVTIDEKHEYKKEGPR